MRRFTLLAITVAFGIATAKLAGHIAVRRERPYDFDFVPSARVVRWLAPGHPTLAADFYWLRAVQYMGEPRSAQRGWSKLFPVIDLITDLDPGHGYAYQVAGNVLASNGQVEESNQILEKGMHNLPDRYILPFHRAVNALLYDGDYVAAGRYFERAASTPGSPKHLREYVLAMYVKGNQADAAIAFLEHLLETSPDDESRKALEKQIQQARLERVALQIDAAIARYRQQFLVPPFGVEQLHALGYLRSIPPDPYGGEWLIGEDGRAHSSVNSFRFKPPMTEEERAAAIRTIQTASKGAPRP